MKPLSLTPASFALLAALVKDAPNWSGTPMLDITKEQRGNLSDLKKNKILHTYRDEGIDWVVFEDGVLFIESEGSTWKLAVVKDRMEWSVNLVPSQ